MFRVAVWGQAIIIIIIKYICRALDRSATKALKVSRWCRTGTLSVVFVSIRRIVTYKIFINKQLIYVNVTIRLALFIYINIQFIG